MLALVTLAVLPACGDDAEGLSAQDYRARASTICAGAVARNDAVIEPLVARLAADLGSVPSTDRLQVFYAKLGPGVRESKEILAGMLADLRALPPPAEDEAAYASLWEAIDSRLAESVGRIERAATDAVEAQALWELEAGPFEDLSSRAVKLGVEHCIPR